VFEHLFRAVRHPDEFRLTVQQLTADPAGECLSTIELADKRVFERYTQPQRLGGLAAGRIWSFRDVSERASAERALRGSEARFRSVFDHAAVGIALIDDEDMIVDTNRAFQSMLGYEAAELRGRPVQELLLADDTVAAPLPFESVRRGQGESATVETRQRHRDGRILWVSVTLSRVEATDSSHRRIVCMTHDITERKELEAQLTHQAFHDALTNLANRALFRDRVERALARQNRGHAEVSVLYVDLDNFKTANDTYGHSQGDALLVATAGRLLNATRGSDTVARIGGDEFAILLEHVHDRQEALRQP
jgi:PAS domain S-box-containing protein